MSSSYCGCVKGGTRGTEEVIGNWGPVMGGRPIRRQTCKGGARGLGALVPREAPPDEGYATRIDEKLAEIEKRVDTGQIRGRGRARERRFSGWRRRR